MTKRRGRFVVGALIAASRGWSPSTGSSASANVDHSGIRKIQHVVVTMQENRSFDSYFGTFAGAGRRRLTVGL